MFTLEGAVDYLLGRTSQNNEAVDSQESADTTYTAAPERTRTNSVEEVDAPRSGAGSIKRRRGVEEQRVEAGRPAKRARQSDDELRLTGNYKIPRDAQPLGLTNPYLNPRQRYSVKEDWEPKKNTTLEQIAPSMGGSRGHGFKPMNTLGTQSKQIARQKPSDASLFNPPPYHAARAENTHNRRYAQPEALGTHLSRGSNVPSQRDLTDYQDDIEQEAGKAAKKRKLNGTTSTHIDLTEGETENETRGDDSNSQWTVIGAQGKKLLPRPSSKRAAELEHNALFGSNELNSVHGRLAEGRNPSRKPSGDSMHSNRSHRSASQATQPSRAPTASAEPPVISIPDEDERRPRTTEGPAKIRSPTNSTRPSQRPAINLDRGVEEAGEQYMDRLAQRKHPGSTGDVSQTNGVLQNNGGRRFVQPSPRQHQQPTRRRVLARPDADRPQSEAEDFPAAGFRDESLRGKFIRDDGKPARPKRSGLVPNMQGDSSPNRIKFSSDDELAGDITIPARSSRNTSPVKALPSQRTPATKRDHTQREQQDTPFRSNIKPTVFEDTGRRIEQPPERVKDIVASDNGQIRIPVEMIVCKAGVLEGDDLELAWDADAGVFVVIRGGDILCAGSTDRALTLGPKEINREWAQDPSSLAVRVRGCKTDTTNGLMHINFSKTKGRSTCLQLLRQQSRDELRIHQIGREEMVKTFNKQMQDVQDFQKSAPQQPRRQLPAVVSRQFRSANTHTSKQDEEHIIFETEEEAPRPAARARARMQGHDGDDSLNAAITAADYQSPRANQDKKLEVSRYFRDQPRRSTRQSHAVSYKEPTPPPVEVEKWTKIYKPSAWPHPVVYPTEGLRKTTVDFQDLERLDEGEWLNDNVVAFTLRYIEENMGSQHREKVHFFNTFFYTSLTTKGTKKTLNYDAVKRWTKNVDIFTKSYVVVPVNADLHWFVAIICNLPHIKRQCDAFDDDEVKHGGGEPEPGATEMITAASESFDLPDALDGHHGSDDTAKGLDNLSLSDRGSATPRDGVFEFGTNGKVAGNQSKEHSRQASPASSRPGTSSGQQNKKKSKKKAPPLRKYDLNEPMIIALDSFGLPRTVELRYLKQYLQAEAKEKRGMDFDWKDLKGMTAKGIPAQANFSDCGVYLSGYVEQFAKDPDVFVRKVLQREMDENNDFAQFDPSKKRDEIRNTLLDLQKKQEEARVASKRAKAAAKRGAQAPSVTPATTATPAPPVSSAPPVTSQKSETSTREQAQKAEVSQGRRETTPLDEVAMHYDSSKTAMADEDDELPVSPPRPHSRSGKQSLPAKTQHVSPHDDDEDEMLDDTIEVAPSARSSAKPAREAIPAHGEADANTTSSPTTDLLHALEEDDGDSWQGCIDDDSKDQEQRRPPVQHKALPTKTGSGSPQVIVSNNERHSLEVPDSQSQTARSVSEVR